MRIPEAIDEAPLAYIGPAAGAPLVLLFPYIKLHCIMARGLAPLLPCINKTGGLGREAARALAIVCV